MESSSEHFYASSFFSVSEWAAPFQCSSCAAIFFDILLVAPRPGRCDIRVRVTIPEGTALAAPLLEGCVWRQARGAATEVSAPELAAASVDKASISEELQLLF